MRIELFVGCGSKGTAAIQSNPVPMRLPTRRPEQLPLRNELPPDHAGRRQPRRRRRTMSTIAETNSLFEIDAELDSLLDEIEEQTTLEGEPSEELVTRFQQFCEAHGEKVDRIGRFVRIMEAREQYCRSESARLTDRARAAADKVERTKNMVLYYLLSRDLQKVEG